jgi:uncharacterized protein YjbJ (UPF0337 family)
VGIFDKARHEAQGAAGRVKQELGRVRGDRPQENQGKREQKLSHLKMAGEHVKDALRRK